MIKKRVIVPSNRNFKSFLFFYGNTSDYFCDDDTKIGSFQKTIFKELEEKGFNRVVFFSTKKGIYSYKEEYLNLFFMNTNETLKEQGPLGDLKVKEVYSNFQKDRAFSLIKLIEICSIKSDLKTAIVFTNPEDLYVENLGEELFKEVKEHINTLSKMLNFTDNLFIFIFNDKKIEDLKNKIKKLPFEQEEITIFTEEFKYRKNTIQIALPEHGEIYNLLNHFRIQDKVELDWENLDSIISLIEKQEMDLQTLYKTLKIFIKAQTPTFTITEKITDAFI